MPLRKRSIFAPEEKIYLVGDGAELVMDFDVTGERFPAPDDRLILLEERLRNQSGCSVALVALEAYRNGQTCSDSELAPVYLRPSQAERMRMERLKNENN